MTPELHRLELHVVDVARMADLTGWPRVSPDPAAMLIKDGDGQLARTLEEWASGPDWTPEDPQTAYDRTLNWLVFASAVAARGEALRAAELLMWVRGGLLRLARFELGLPHFPAATRLAEHDLDGWAGRIAGAATPTQALALCRELAAALGLEPRAGVLAALEARGR